MAQNKGNPWRKELQSTVRALTRALIFGIALIYTMETWWIGSFLDYWKLMLFFILAFFVSLYLIPVTAGQAVSHSPKEIVRIAVRNKGIAVLVAAGLLWLLGRISLLQAPLERDVATIVLLSIPIEFGSSVARILEVYASLGPRAGGQQKSGAGESQEEQSGQSGHERPWLFVLKVAAATSGGALFVALPLAPTMEVPLLAARLSFWRELAVIGLSLLVSYLIIYSTGMTRTAPSGPDAPGSGIWPYADTLLSYAISLFAGTVMLYLFGRIQVFSAPEHVLSLVVVLGLPATIGGAAGKLAL